MSRHHWMYFGSQYSSARCSRLLLDKSTLLGIFSAEITKPSLRAFPVELGPTRLSVHFQRPLLADGIRPLKDPVLPRRQPAEDFGLHGFGPREPQVRFESRHGVRRKGRPRLDGDAHLVVPVDLVGGEGDQASRLGLSGIEGTD